MLRLKSVQAINPMTLKLMYQHISNYIKSEINIYTEMNASNANNQIGLEEKIYFQINASNQAIK